MVPDLTRRTARSRGALAVSGRAVAAAAKEGPILFLLSAMLFVLVFRLHELIPFARYMKPALLAGPIGFAVMLGLANHRDRVNIAKDRMIWWVAAYVLWAGATVPFALFRGLALETFIGLFSLLLLVLAYGVQAPTFQRLRKAQFLFALLGGMLAVATLIFGRGSLRVSVGSTLDPNDLGAMMAVTLPLALGCVRTERGIRRFLCLAVAILAVTVLIKANSRGGTVAVVVAMTSFVLLLPSLVRWRWIAIVAFAGTLSWFAAPPHFQERMRTLTSLESDYNNTEYGGRKQIWKRGWGYARENPVFGVGVGNFPIAEGYNLKEMGARGKWSAAHNAYVQASAELGFVGGAIFVGMLLFAAIKSWQWTSIGSPKGTRAELIRPEYFASLLGLMIASYFLSFAYFWATFGLLGLISLADRVRTDPYSDTTRQPAARSAERLSRGASRERGAVPSRMAAYR